MIATASKRPQLLKVGHGYRLRAGHTLLVTSRFDPKWGSLNLRCDEFLGWYRDEDSKWNVWAGSRTGRYAPSDEGRSPLDVIEEIEIG